MTYRAGTRGLSRYGIRDGDPRIICDGCSRIYPIPRRGPCGAPPAWVLDMKAPPKWRKIGELHMCPECCKPKAKEPNDA